MVHQTRTPSKAIPAKHLSPMRPVEGLGGGKYAVSSSPADGFLRNNNSNRLTEQSSSGYPQSTAFKYNQMVANNREQFNNLHFC